MKNIEKKQEPVMFSNLLVVLFFVFLIGYVFLTFFFWDSFQKLYIFLQGEDMIHLTKESKSLEAYEIEGFGYALIYGVGAGLSFAFAYLCSYFFEKKK